MKIKDAYVGLVVIDEDYPDEEGIVISVNFDGKSNVLVSYPDYITDYSELGFMSWVWPKDLPEEEIAQWR